MSSSTPTSNPYATKETWTAAVERIFNGPDSEVESAILVLYDPDVTITANGATMKMADFIPYARYIRSLASSVKITSHAFLRDGDLFADKHTVLGTGVDGGPGTKVEVMVIGQLSEGRCVWIEERAGEVETI